MGLVSRVNLSRPSPELPALAKAVPTGSLSTGDWAASPGSGSAVTPEPRTDETRGGASAPAAVKGTTAPAQGRAPGRGSSDPTRPDARGSRPRRPTPVHRRAAPDRHRGAIQRVADARHPRPTGGGQGPAAPSTPTAADRSRRFKDGPAPGPSFQPFQPAPSPPLGLLKGSEAQTSLPPRAKPSAP